jgi:hypothetical protein
MMTIKREHKIDMIIWITKIVNGLTFFNNILQFSKYDYDEIEQQYREAKDREEKT